jgi:hypothetical protein
VPSNVKTAPSRSINDLASPATFVTKKCTELHRKIKGPSAVYSEQCTPLELNKNTKYTAHASKDNLPHCLCIMCDVDIYNVLKCLWKCVHFPLIVLRIFDLGCMSINSIRHFNITAGADTCT